MGFREALRDNPATNGLYCKLRDVKHKYVHKQHIKTAYQFTDRRRGEKKTC